MVTLYNFGTGADASLAQNLLEACGNNLEMAINMHMEGAVDSGNPQAAGPASVVNNYFVIFTVKICKCLNCFVFVIIMKCYE